MARAMQELRVGRQLHCPWYLHGSCQQVDKRNFTHDANEKGLLLEKEIAILMKQDGKEKLEATKEEKDAEEEQDSLRGSRHHVP